MFIRTMSNVKWPDGLVLKNTFEIIFIITIIVIPKTIRILVLII